MVYFKRFVLYRRQAEGADTENATSYFAGIKTNLTIAAPTPAPLSTHHVNCLQKFRSGEYNILVATSIGEEGLDIVEVDLVICFDANVSPLRMIQRMGRTGRKNDGRVDILS
jgi:superfamily II DNA or RNA helicase